MGKLIKGGTVVTAEREWLADVRISGEKVVEVGPDLVANGEEIIDATGAYVMPGGIDPHTHMQLPFMGTVASEDFFTGTTAAMCGGTTTIIDFCIPSPQQPVMDAWKTWNEWAEKSAGDFSFHVAITWWDDTVSRDMGILARDHGVNSFKHFTAYKGAIMCDDEILVNSFTRCRELGALCTVHAENGELVYRLQQQVYDSGITGPEGHPLSRPPVVEGEAANRVIQIAGVLGTPIYLVHNSCADSLAAITRARLAGQRVFGEVLAQHLIFSDEVYRNPDWNKAAHYVMSPPFRPRHHQRELWKGVQAGMLQTSATDHCCFCTPQKQMGLEDFRKIPNGTNGVEDRMAVLWEHGVNTGRLTRMEYVALTSANAAKIFNIYPQKGTIGAGSDADIVIWDPTAQRTISKDEHHQNIDFNIYEGMTCTGVPAITLSRGMVVWDRGDVRSVRGRGKYIKRPTNAPYWQAINRWNEANEPTAVERVLPERQSMDGFGTV